MIDSSHMENASDRAKKSDEIRRGIYDKTPQYPNQVLSDELLTKTQDLRGGVYLYPNISISSMNSTECSETLEG